MIPVLYNADETRFITNGRGRLSDTISAIVTEIRNGIYELEFQVPITGVHFDEIEIGRIVTATHDDKGDVQPFEIYARSVPDLNGVVTFNAHHISYKLCDVVVMPFTAGSCAAALQGIKDHSVNANPFEFWTDKTTDVPFSNMVPRLARNMLGGEENSILDVFGTGEYEFDKWTVKLHAARGTDSDVEIRYSKNLTDLSQNIDDSDSYNAVVPYWADEEGNIVTLPEKVLVYTGINPRIAYLTDHNLIIIRTEDDEPIEVAYTQVIASPLDMSDQFEEKPTVAQLRAAAQARFERSNAWLPHENITVDFVQLWQTEEFKEYSALQRVGLCDTVSVYYPQAGIEAVKQKVVKTVYNVLLDRYDSIELGAVQTSLGQAIRQDILTEVPTNSMMQSAIKYATDLIRGGLGGYVVMTPGPDGYPQEILIMDTPDVNTAVNVWRFNQGGLGHSSTGYEGPFSDIALTQDGKINASMITAGVMNANLIRAGTISDNSGKNSWNLVSGQFKTQQGKIGGFDITNTGINYSSNSRVIDLTSSRFAFIKRAYNTWGSYETTGFIFKENAAGGAELALVDKWPSSDIDDYNEVGCLQLYSYSSTGQSGGVGADYALTYIDKNLNGSVFIAAKDEFMLYSTMLNVQHNAKVFGNLNVIGTKSRSVDTDNYDERLLYCYETPSPMFGDIGEAELDEEGICYVDLDDIFSETIAARTEYQVFLQKEGEGDCWIADKSERFFIIRGTPGLKVAWELKAKQKGYKNIRLEPTENKLDEYAPDNMDIDLEDYIKEQEGLLYGND